MKSIFSKNLAHRRNHLGITQQHAAMRLNVKIKTYAAWEEARSEPDIKMLIAITEVFLITDLYRFIKIELVK